MKERLLKLETPASKLITKAPNGNFLGRHLINVERGITLENVPALGISYALEKKWHDINFNVAF